MNSDCSMSNMKAVDIARKFIGCPYRHQGRNPGLAMDCIGLIYSIAMEMQIRGVEMPIYGIEPEPDKLISGLRQWLIEEWIGGIGEAKGYSPPQPGGCGGPGAGEGEGREEGQKVENFLSPGKVLLFRIRREPQHVGIVSNHWHGGLGLIHAYSGAGRVVEHSLDQRWIDRIERIYRWPS